MKAAQQGCQTSKHTLPLMLEHRTRFTTVPLKSTAIINAVGYNPQKTMALSRREIIGAHPIGDALTFFRDAYNSRCVNLGSLHL